MEDITYYVVILQVRGYNIDWYDEDHIGPFAGAESADAFCDKAMEEYDERKYRMVKLMLKNPASWAE